MAGLTADDLNEYLGVAVVSEIDGRLVLNLEALDGRTLDLQASLAQPIFRLLQAMNGAAIARQKSTASYLPIQQRERGGQLQLFSTVAVIAELSKKAKALNSTLFLNGRPLQVQGEALTL